MKVLQLYVAVQELDARARGFQQLKLPTEERCKQICSRTLELDHAHIAAIIRKQTKTKVLCVCVSSISSLCCDTRGFWIAQPNETFKTRNLLKAEARLKNA
eukprot:1538663-Amphidinium_carterae.1